MMLDELGRRQAAQSGVWSEVVVVEAPGFDRGPRVEDRRKRVLVEQLVAEAPVEALDAPVLHRPARLDEVQLDIGLSRPAEHRIARELGAVVELQGRRQAPQTGESREGAHNAITGKREIHLDADRLAGEIVHDRERSIFATVTEHVVHEVERPALIWTADGRDGVTADVAHTALAPGTQLKPFNAIDPMNALVVDDKAFTPQHHRQPSITEASPLCSQRLEPFEQPWIVHAPYAVLRD